MPGTVLFPAVPGAICQTKEVLSDLLREYIRNGGTDIGIMLFNENGNHHCFQPHIKEETYRCIDADLKQPAPHMSLR